MKTANICIIDDNVAVCDSLKFLFESFLTLKIKLTVKTYNDPLIFLQEFPHDWEGCLIIDLFMPSMNGIDLIIELKKINPNIHIIIISGHGTAYTGALALESGASAFITKPFKTDHLLDKVKQFLKIDD